MRKIRLCKRPYTRAFAQSLGSFAHLLSGFAAYASAQKIYCAHSIQSIPHRFPAAKETKNTSMYYYDAFPASIADNYYFFSAMMMTWHRLISVLIKPVQNA
jgi:hypothetical protein